jgi:hypothetical protein
LVLIGRKVESIVPGGPAFHSRQISIGDNIIEIDGTATTEENIGDLILGGDEPGTPVSITIRKEDSKVLRGPFFVLSLQSAVAVISGRACSRPADQNGNRGVYRAPPTISSIADASGMRVTCFIL